MNDYTYLKQIAVSIPLLNKSLLEEEIEIDMDDYVKSFLHRQHLTYMDTTTNCLKLYDPVNGTLLLRHLHTFSSVLVDEKPKSFLSISAIKGYRFEELVLKGSKNCVSMSNANCRTDRWKAAKFLPNQSIQKNRCYGLHLGSTKTPCTICSVATSPLMECSGLETIYS